VHPTLTVSLDCLRPVSCVPHVDSNNLETLSTRGTQNTGRRQSRDTVNVGYTRHRMKTIHRHCQRGVHKTQGEDKQYRDSVNVEYARHRLCLVYPTLTVSLDCLRHVSCVPHVDSISGLSSQDTGRRQFRDTVNVEYTRHRAKTNNLETVSTWSTQDTGRRQTIQRHCFVLYFVYPTLTVSLDCLSSSCVLCTPR
jgi:hypothetical protein